jgi:SAM-dependent methyltransferase
LVRQCRPRVRKVLNVGGGNKDIPLPTQYQGWQRVLLDIDPRGLPDVLCDARKLDALPAAQYDAVYCSHNLEHYYPHDVPRVLAGFRHVLKPDGFAHIIVPDIAAVMSTAVEKRLDIGDVLYRSPAGPITVHDVIYGYGVEIESSGDDFYAHKTGFTEKSLSSALTAAGFGAVFVVAGNLELQSLAFKQDPPAYAAKLFGLPVASA